jgi:diacylglycerol kinase family enzyme
VPPFLKFHSGVSLDDGVFDVVILSADGFLDSVGAFLQLLSGGPDRGQLHYARGSEITVVMEPTRPVQADGDRAGDTPFTARVLPAALRVLVPKNGA